MARDVYRVLLAGVLWAGWLVGGGQAQGPGVQGLTLGANQLAGSGAVGGLPPELVPKIERLAAILQQNIQNGTLSDARIQQELQGGDLAAVIRGLGPEPASLLDEISGTLKGRYSQDTLSVMLSGLMQQLPQGLQPPPAP